MSENKNSNGKKRNKQLLIVAGIVLGLIIVAVCSIVLMKNQKEEKENELPYTELIKEIASGKVEKVEMTTGSTTVKVKLVDEEEDKKTIVPSTQTFMDLIQEQVGKGNEIELIQ